MILVFKDVGSYIQTQILDFLGKVTLRHTRKSPLIKGRSKKRKKNVRMKKIMSEIASGVQKTLEWFTNVLRKVKERVSKYVPSFKTPKASPYTGDKLTEIEKISYLCKTTYRGDIRHLFLFYPFDERLDAWERENHPENYFMTYRRHRGVLDYGKADSQGWTGVVSSQIRVATKTKRQENTLIRMRGYMYMETT